MLQLLFASKTQAEELAPQIVRKASEEPGDSELQGKVVELVERLLLLRFPEFDREAMRMKFKLHDIRESKVWQEAHEEGRGEGRGEGREEGDARRLKKTIETLLTKHKTIEEIAKLLDITEEEIARALENRSH